MVKSAPLGLEFIHYYLKFHLKYEGCANKACGKLSALPSAA